MSSNYTEEPEAPSAIRVLVRVRPLNDRESKSKNVLQLQSGETTAIDFGIKATQSSSAATVGEESLSSSAAEGTVSIVGDTQQGGGASFTYDRVFGPESKQIDIFESVKGLVEAVVSGYNGTIVAYGQTSSGKTHTIFGECDDDDDEEEAAGLVQRSLKSIFEKMDNNSSSSLQQQQQQQHSAKASFFEIYNEKVYDLLSSNENMLQESLAVREDSSSRGVYVEGLTEHEVHNTADAMDVLRVGNENRRVASTSMNRVSSRSHAVFVLTVKNIITNDVDGTSKVLESKFTLVDLAGSERQKTTDAAGERLKEASMINNSLLCLGQVINSLVDREKGKERHVPFRDSKLTFLLRDSWGGNSKTCLVATVTPSSTSIAETISTLKFAQRAKLIKNTAVKNETYSVEALQMEIARLKSELEQRGSNVMGGVTISSSESSDGSSVDHITISSLRNHNSTLNEKVKVLKDRSNMMEQQVNSLKRKLQQETMIRKCKERRITFLSSKSTDEDMEKEVIGNLQTEVNMLREQLESKQSPESIHWMMKYKEEKVKLDQLLASNPAAMEDVTNRAELDARLDSLLASKESLEKQLASIQLGRHSEMDVLSRDAAKLEKEIIALKSHLAKKEAEVSQYKAEMVATQSQIHSLDKDRIEALEFLETVNSELVAEQKKVVELQASVDSMTQMVQEKENNAKDYQAKEAAQQVELNDAKVELQSLQKDLDAAKEENCSLIKDLSAARNDLSAKENEVVLLKSENEQALASFDAKQKEAGDMLESLEAQLKDKEEQLAKLLQEKTELEENIENISSQNASVLAESEALKKTGCELQQRVDSLENTLDCISQEKKQVDEELISARGELESTVTLHEESIAKVSEGHDAVLVQRDDTISLLQTEKEALQSKLDTIGKDFETQIEILQNTITSTEEECDNVKQKEANLLSTLDALTDGYDQLRVEKEGIEKELKETKKLLKKNTAMIAELEGNNEAEMVAVKEECEVLKQKEQHLLSDLEAATNTSSELKLENEAIQNELVATKALLEDSTATSAELESSNESKTEELNTLQDELTAAKEKEEQLITELGTVKNASSQLQLEKEVAEKDLAETKAPLENSALAIKELERSTSAKAAEMEASMDVLKSDLAQVSEENEAAKVFETQVAQLTLENRSLQETIENLQSSLSDCESAKIELDQSAASKVNEMQATLTSIHDEHATEISGLKEVIESLKAEMTSKEDSAAVKLSEMEDFVESIKIQHAEEKEQLNNQVDTLKTSASDKEQANTDKLKEIEELVASTKVQHMEEVERLNICVESLKARVAELEDCTATKAAENQELVHELKDQHAVEIERLQQQVDAAQKEVVSKEENAAQKLNEVETAMANLKHQHAVEIEQMKQEAEIAKVQMFEKEGETSSRLKEMEDMVANLKGQHSEEIERLNGEAEALKSDAKSYEESSAAKLSEMEAEAANLHEKHVAEINRLSQQADAARAEMLQKEEMSSLKLKEMEELIETMKVQHAEEMLKMNLEVESLKEEALSRGASANDNEVSEDMVKNTTFDDEDDDFDEDMFLPNVDIQPDASEIEAGPPSSPVVDSATAEAAEVVDAPNTVVAEKRDENSPILSPSLTPFKTRRDMFANRAEKNAADEKTPFKKPPPRRSRRTTAPKTEQTPVQRVTRRSTRLSTSRTPFTDLGVQDTSVSSTRKVRTNFQRGALD